MLTKQYINCNFAKICKADQDMDTTFVYDRFVTGKHFIGRKAECVALANLLEAGEHVVIYEPPKTGIKSVIQQTLFDMRMKGRQFMVGQLDLFNVRTISEFLVSFGSSVIRPVTSTPNEYAAIVSKYLSGTHFIFDKSRFASDAQEVVSLNLEPDKTDIEAMLRLPGLIARDKGIPFFMNISQFSNLLKTEDSDLIFKTMEKVMSDKSQEGPATVFILTGSTVNAMKYIFEEKKFFYRMVEHLPLHCVDNREIIEYIVKGFMISGKVVERELVLGACRLFRSNLWYLNHFFAICDSLSKGYINESVLMEALSMIISIHEPKFRSIVDDLTDFQLSLLKAVLDGVMKFSSVDVISKYSLNSSANVRRVKDALKKKEVLTFNEKDEPIILDPLFEYWVSKCYFGMNK